jgi:hypothetical protein
MEYPTAWVPPSCFPLEPNIYFLILPHVKKLLDFWMIFSMQIVPHCLFFSFLIMKQSWAGQSLLLSENKATSAQVDCAAPGLIYAAEAGPVYTLRPELHLDVSALQTPVLHLDMSTPHKT